MFLKGPSANVRIVAFILASLIMMTVDHRQGHLEKLRSTLSVFVYPLQYIANLPVTVTNWATEALTTRTRLVEENALLRDEQLVLSSKIQKFEILEAENERLREMLESSKRLDERVLIAKLLAVDLQPFRHQIVINKGQREGVYDGQPIVDANGVMGQIVHVGPFSSTVLLLTDPTHAIPVQVNRNGLRSVAVGTGQNHVLQLEHLSNNVDIKEGDLVVSSGLGSRFPPGYPVGVVQTISRVPGEPFAKVTILPSAQLEKSREVLLVWPETRSRSLADFESLADDAAIPARP
ncbi:MAG: rod shape-determining protein MreC [Gammaproteobacteria bacterium]|nr:MAG: rod shape-determining protein MreC [Gammaproteobacteria bacterium]